MTKQLHLAGFLIASHMTHSHPAWRHPLNDLNFLRPEFYQNLGRILERGKFDYVFFADGLMIPNRYGAGIADTLRYGSQVFFLDPAFVVATMAVATEYIGLGITRSTTYLAPFDLARTFASFQQLIFPAHLRSLSSLSCQSCSAGVYSVKSIQVRPCAII